MAVGLEFVAARVGQGDWRDAAAILRLDADWLLAEVERQTEAIPAALEALRTHFTPHPDATKAINRLSTHLARS
jgi:hypothetical protein